jgi:hypothetical protein
MLDDWWMVLVCRLHFHYRLFPFNLVFLCYLLYSLVTCCDALFSFFVVLGFEFRAYTLATPHFSPFVMGFFETGSPTVWTGLESQSHLQNKQSNRACVLQVKRPEFKPQYSPKKKKPQKHKHKPCTGR